jgi:hypothetical protein
MTQQNGEQVVFPLGGDEQRYDLAGEGVQIQITYTRLAEALPALSLSYQGLDGGNGTFSRNDIRSLDSELGTLLTVTLPNTMETQQPIKTILSVFLPVVHPTGSPEWSANLKTLAIVTTSIGLPTDPLPKGQAQTYQVYELEGTLTYTLLPHRVKLTLDGASYHVGDPISVTLSNQSAQTIEFPDQQSECSVIQLQRQENGNWKEVNPCIRGRQIIMNTLEAGKDLTVKLVSSSESPGLYRATLSYGIRFLHELQPETISSQEFQVIANPEGH